MVETKHYGYLDGWRGLAILSVLAAHFIGVHWIDLGRLGVDLFFVLSGLLMSKILYEDRVSLRRFYARRFSRVMPVFLLFVCVVAVIYAMPADELLATFTFTRTYWPSPSIWQAAAPINHIWSLNVEEHSYVLLATLSIIPILRRREGFVLIGLSIATMAVYMIYRHMHVGGDFELRTECAATGLLMSAGYRQVRRHFDSFVRPWMPVLAFVIGVACYVAGTHDLLRAFMAPVLFAFSINHIGDSYAAVNRMLSSKPLQLMGLWSYSLYIWQQPFYKASVAPWIGLCLAIACALASFYLFEQPIRKWLNGRRIALPALPENA